ncbi:hypothetical protein QQZ08_007395 [Neonectria magnoliae]|uniref:BZIP domain-containing protein n=1 Tax=Neonectria magnoliae TaxID=2732573 RepID=A0ABR1HXS6_9HYPO
MFPLPVTAMFSGDLAYIRPPRRRASTPNTIEMRSWAEIERRRSEETAASRAKAHRTKRLNASVVMETRRVRWTVRSLSSTQEQRGRDLVSLDVPTTNAAEHARHQDQ